MLLPLPLLYLTVFLLLATSLYTLFLHVRLRRFLTGEGAVNLESQILSDRETMAEMTEQNKKLSEKINLLEKKISQSIRSVETVRFNPFPDQGSNQSFATALLDETGAGVVFSSLYSRERISVFAKPVESFASSYGLTEEEKQVIEQTHKKQYAN